MDEFVNNTTVKLARYILWGLIIGLFFPAWATYIGFARAGVPFSLNTALAMHRIQPLYLIIDTVPLVLGAFSAVIGHRSQRFFETNQQLQEMTLERAQRFENESQFFKSLITSSPIAIIQLDHNHKIIALNPAFEELFGYTSQEIVGQEVDKIVVAPLQYEEAIEITKRVTSGEVVRKVGKRRKKDGRSVDVEIIGIPVFSGGVKIGALGLYHDISPRVEAEQALKLSELRFRSLFNDSPVSLWEEDFSQVRERLYMIGKPAEIIDRLENDDELVKECVGLVRIINVNQATLDLYNAASKAELIVELMDVLVDESLGQFRNELIALVNGESCFECEIVQKKKTGEVIDGLLRLSMAPGYENTWEKVLISILDITQRKRSEKKLRFMSYHDNLTGLHNRAFFDESLNELENSDQYPISIISFDLDKLKTINDKNGHEAGDRAIRGVAQILSNVFRKEDIVARIGGDEFVAIVPTVDLNQVNSFSRRLEHEIEAYNKRKGDGLYRPISLSYGISTITEGESLIEGYKLADELMYRAKAEKRSQAEAAN